MEPLSQIETALVFAQFLLVLLVSIVAYDLRQSIVLVVVAQFLFFVAYLFVVGPVVRALVLGA